MNFLDDFEPKRGFINFLVNDLKLRGKFAIRPRTSHSAVIGTHAPSRIDELPRDTTQPWQDFQFDA